MPFSSRRNVMSVDLIDLWPIIVLAICVPMFALVLMSR